MERERSVRIPCGAIELEGRFRPPARGGAVGLVMCHPHPLYGGDMHNNVVAGVCRAVGRFGWATLRFNFRGVGSSGGSHGQGEPETDDVRAALDWMAARLDGSPVFLAGYSFGAWVGARALAAGARAPGFAAVAPPLALYPLDELSALGVPRLLVVGGRDPYCPPERLGPWVGCASGPLEVVRIAGADHFFVGVEDQVGGAVARFLQQVLEAMPGAGR